MSEETSQDTPKSRKLIYAGAAAILVIAVAAYAFLGQGEPRKKSKPVNMVNIMPPPPPPPPPPPTPPPATPPPLERPPEETKQPEFVEETQPDSPPEPVAEAPPQDAAPMGTNIEGDGPADGFGLSGRGGGGLIGGTGTGKGGGGGSKYGAYAGQVQRRVAEALRGHKRTKSATLSVKVRVWADASGRVTRVKLSESTGDAALDRTLTEEVLNGLQLDGPPPQDMPMPIVMRLSAKRP